MIRYKAQKDPYTDLLAYSLIELDRCPEMLQLHTGQDLLTAPVWAHSSLPGSTISSRCPSRSTV
ncbi:MAG: hypothetical protein ABJ171_09350 [Halieaceae bacterium]